jgi:hypothetical protein
MLALIGIAAMSVWPGGDAEAARALVARDDAQRLRAVLEVARAEPVRAAALLVPALRDRDPNVRLAAARLLARRGSREATRAATAWLGDASPRERLLGLLVLRDAAELPDEARRAVERALRNGDVTTRLQGLELLAARPAASSFGAVVAQLEDELAEIRLRALRALAAMGDARASLAVTRRLADADRGVRLEAATTLGALGDRRAVPALLRQLQPGEAASDPHTAAVDALGRLGEPAALPVLARLAGRSPRDDLARHAALALGALGTPAAVEALLAIAREPPGPDDVRLALERAGAPAVPRLCEEVATGSPTSARLAVEALGRLADRRATGALVAIIERGTGPTVAALEALARLADPAAVPALVRVAMDGPAPELRGLALEALQATGGAGALVALPRALADVDATVRARAARLAGTLGEAGLAAGTATRLRDPDVDVRRETARALARLPSLAAEMTSPVVEALSRAAATTPDLATLDALGAVLERAVRASDGPALARTYLAAPSGEARAAMARGLAAAFAEAPLVDETVIAALLRDAGEGGDPALAAAEALGSARLSREDQKKLVVLYARAEDIVRARLASALASFAEGADMLASGLGDAGAAPSVRAASAWALAGHAGAREALRLAASAPEQPIAANARAALAAAHEDVRRRARWSAVALTSADGGSAAGLWVTVTAGDGAPVWALTDSHGRARVAALPEGNLSVRIPRE